METNSEKGVVKEMKCWIIREWECYLEDGEIPLEACKLCVEARLRHIMIKRGVKSE